MRSAVKTSEFSDDPETEIFYDPETDDGFGPDVEVPTYEELTETLDTEVLETDSLIGSYFFGRNSLYSLNLAC